VSGKHIRINEVVTRDGLQIEPVFVPTRDKIALIDALSHTGVSKIEVTSFVSPKAVPALADATEVMRGITRAQNVIYVALAPNARGAAAAVEAGADEINIVISASESHNYANVRRTCDQSFDELSSVNTLRKGSGVTLNGTIATAFGCPFDGHIAPSRIVDFARRYRDAGADSLTLADTTGMANPVQVEQLVIAVSAACPSLPLTLHFHNTRGMGLANILAAHRVGARSFDAALGGLGGCPFAPGATGNVCTEDVVHMFEQMGVATGVDLQSLVTQSLRLPLLVGHDTPGQVVKAGPSFARERSRM
jgi:hydroxymethylglutaryl-CoA lyase